MVISMKNHYCQWCGKELLTDGLFCPYCGRPIDDSDGTSLQKNRNRRARRSAWPLAVLCIVLVLGIAAAGIWFLNLKGILTFGKNQTVPVAATASPTVEPGAAQNSVFPLTIESAKQYQGKIVHYVDFFGLKADGTVVAVEWSNDSTDALYETSGWTDIVAVAASHFHTAGLRSDGAVVVFGESSFDRYEATNWTDIAAIATTHTQTIGLRRNGTVAATGPFNEAEYDMWFGNTHNWTDIAAIAAANQHVLGLRSDGTVVSSGSLAADGTIPAAYATSGWTDIVAIAASDNLSVGLKRDGTVVAAGAYTDTRNLTDIAAVVAATSSKLVQYKQTTRYEDIYQIAGLRNDGTVVAVGNNEFGQCETSGWTDIVAIAANGCRTVGLKCDGTVVAAGDFDSDDLDQISKWTNVVAISIPINNSSVVGLLSDGTVVCTDPDLDFSSWDLF